MKAKKLFYHHCMTSSLSISGWKLVAKTVTFSSGRLKLNEKHPLDVSRADEKGPTVRCNDCLSPIGKGFPHNCNQSTFRENPGLAAQDEKVAEQIAAKVIASKTASPKGTVRLSKPSGGPPPPVTPGASFNSEYLK